jgi:hypothetical protein
MAKTSILNWVPAAILSSPAHLILSGKRLVLSFTGRRSGTRYATPVNYLQRGSELLITTDSRWWHNLAGGAPAGLRLRGRRVQASAEAIRDPGTVARVGPDGTPEPADVHAEVARGRVRVHLPAGEPSPP